MNPTLNKSDFEDLTTHLKDLAYSYLLINYNPVIIAMINPCLCIFILKLIRFAVRTPLQ